MISFKVIDVGLKPYPEVLQLQEELFNKSIEHKLNNRLTENHLILCEHKPVFTLGKSGRRENILVSDEQMNAEFYKVNRGGDVTFHGPGQLVVYPVLDLDVLHIGLAQYILQLEETIIQSLKPYGLKGERIENAAGIWLRGNGNDRKIGAIGVKASRNVTMHGIAVNINTDLSYFDKIVPCGLKGKETTSLQKELGKETAMDDYKQLFIKQFCSVFSVRCQLSTVN
ncbi:MAG: lipoyl(octanoyl) transferase LipB [Bacteroidota bacterium]